MEKEDIVVDENISIEGSINEMCTFIDNVDIFQNEKEYVASVKKHLLDEYKSDFFDNEEEDLIPYSLVDTQIQSFIDTSIINLQLLYMCYRQMSFLKDVFNNKLQDDNNIKNNLESQIKDNSILLKLYNDISSKHNYDYFLSEIKKVNRLDMDILKEKDSIEF